MIATLAVSTALVIFLIAVRGRDTAHEPHAYSESSVRTRPAAPVDSFGPHDALPSSDSRPSKPTGSAPPHHRVASSPAFRRATSASALETALENDPVSLLADVLADLPALRSAPGARRRGDPAAAPRDRALFLHIELPGLSAEESLRNQRHELKVDSDEFHFRVFWFARELDRPYRIHLRLERRDARGASESGTAVEFRLKDDGTITGGRSWGRRDDPQEPLSWGTAMTVEVPGLGQASVPRDRRVEFDPDRLRAVFEARPDASFRALFGL